jgi:hypothetical protein
MRQIPYRIVELTEVDTDLTVAVKSFRVEPHVLEKYSLEGRT